MILKTPTTAAKRHIKLIAQRAIPHPLNPLNLLNLLNPGRFAAPGRYHNPQP